MRAARPRRNHDAQVGHRGVVRPLPGAVRVFAHRHRDGLGLGKTPGPAQRGRHPHRLRPAALGNAPLHVVRGRVRIHRQGQRRGRGVIVVKGNLRVGHVQRAGDARHLDTLTALRQRILDRRQVERAGAARCPRGNDNVKARHRRIVRRGGGRAPAHAHRHRLRRLVTGGPAHRGRHRHLRLPGPLAHRDRGDRERNPARRGVIIVNGDFRIGHRQRARRAVHADGLVALVKGIVRDRQRERGGRALLTGRNRQAEVGHLGVVRALRGPVIRLAHHHRHRRRRHVTGRPVHRGRHRHRARPGVLIQAGLLTVRVRVHVHRDRDARGRRVIVGDRSYTRVITDRRDTSRIILTLRRVGQLYLERLAPLIQHVLRRHHRQRLRRLPRGKGQRRRRHRSEVRRQRPAVHQRRRPIHRHYVLRRTVPCHLKTQRIPFCSARIPYLETGWVVVVVDGEHGLVYR